MLNIEYSNAHFANCECPKRIVKTLWALAVCATFGAFCGGASGVSISFLLILIYGFADGISGLASLFAFTFMVGAVAGFYAGLIGAVLGGSKGWFTGGFFGGAPVGFVFFLGTGFIGGIIAIFIYNFVALESDCNKLCRWILSTYNHSDLGEWRTRKLWIAPVFAFYFLSLYSAFRLLSTY